MATPNSWIKAQIKDLCQARTSRANNGWFCRILRISTPSGLSCDAALLSFRFWWNPSVQQCQTFSFLGAGGDWNNFLSLSDCQNFCSSSVCPAGQPLKDNSNVNYIICSSNSQCPTTHYCNNNVCCLTQRKFLFSNLSVIAQINFYEQKFWNFKYDIFLI